MRQIHISLLFMKRDSLVTIAILEQTMKKFYEPVELKQLL